MLVTGIGVVLAALLLVLGQRLAEPLAEDGFTLLPYLLLVVEGLIVGAVLGRLVGYYPSLEGLLASLTVVVWLLWRDEFQLGLDNFVEILLKFEAHFAALYLAAFILFLARGGGVIFPLLVGMRYLRFKMITSISVAGVALGVAAMVVVLSVMSGFENDLKDRIVGTNAHAIVQKRGIDFDEWRLVREKVLSVPGVVAATPFVYNEVMISSEFNIAGIFVRGIDVDTASSVTDIDGTIVAGRLDLLGHPEKIDDYLKRHTRQPGIVELLAEPLERLRARLGRDTAQGPAAGKVERQRPADDVQPAPGDTDLAGDDVPLPEPLTLETRPGRSLGGVFIGSELKKILKVRIGDRVNIVSPLSEELGPSGPVPKARSFRVAGVFQTGMYEYDAKSVYITLRQAQDFFGLGDTVTGIALKLANLDRAAAICRDIVSVLDGYPYYTRTWYDMNRNLFTALKMEKVGMFILVVIVTLVSAFGIIATLIMLVWEKIKEIAILKSMGATGDGVMKIFMFEGITIGLVGTGLGLLLGWVVCELLQNFGFQLNPEVYYMQNLPVNMDPVEFILIGAIAMHISFIATVYPARRASRFRPVEGLRYD